MHVTEICSELLNLTARHTIFQQTCKQDQIKNKSV